MKRFLLIAIPFIFFGCKNTISYELRNHTNYDAILIDQSDINKSEYFIKANTTITIDHYDSGHFSLKDNTYPIEVFNGFSSTSINNMSTYELSVYNNTDKTFCLNIKNSKHPSTYSFNIPSNFNDNIFIYLSNQPEIELLDNNTLYDNYVINDNCLVIY